MFGIDVGLGEIVGGITTLGASLWGLWKRKQLINVVKESVDVIQEYRKTKNEKSEGGASITEKEMDKLIEELEQALKAVAGAFYKKVT